MAQVTYRTILVIGDNHKEIAAKYSYNEESGENKNVFYKYERCQQHRLEVTGEEGDFSDPFILTDGTISYSAHYNDIDWSKIHKNPERVRVHQRMWEMVMEGSAPNNGWEKGLFNRLKNRRSYFVDNFNSKEEYVNHSTSLWYWGVATEEKYEEVNEDIAKEWVSNFFDRFIAPLEKTNPLITIYETHSLD